MTRSNFTLAAEKAWQMWAQVMDGGGGSFITNVSAFPFATKKNFFYVNKADKEILAGQAYHQ